MLKLRDIAELAQVSTTAVSLVLNNKRGVSEKKRAYINRLLTENGYKIQYENEDKQNIPSERIRNIRFIKYVRHSLLVKENPGFVNDIIDSTEQECRALGYNLIITTCDSLNLKSTLDYLRENPMDGTIFLGTELSEQDMLFLELIDGPMVVVDNALPMKNIDSVTSDNYQSIFTAFDYLYSLGHRQIGFLANSIPSNNCLEREAAYEKAVAHHGLPLNQDWIYSIYPTVDGSHDSMASLLSRSVQFPPALIANNDSIALGAMRALKEFGFCIPNDISIIGYDDISFSSLSEPQLTTLSVPRDSIGRWTVMLLDKRISALEQAATLSIPSVKLKIGTSLVVRGSTCNPLENQ